MNENDRHQSMRYEKIQLFCRSNNTVFSCQYLCQKHSHCNKIPLLGLFLICWFLRHFPPHFGLNAIEDQKTANDQSAKHVFDTLTTFDHTKKFSSAVQKEW